MLRRCGGADCRDGYSSQVNKGVRTTLSGQAEPAGAKRRGSEASGNQAHIMPELFGWLTPREQRERSLYLGALDGTSNDLATAASRPRDDLPFGSGSAELGSGQDLDDPEGGGAPDNSTPSEAP
jgi:hypothetical protein